MRYKIVVSDRSWKPMSGYLKNGDRGVTGLQITYSTRLSVRSQLLQLLIIAELDLDIDSPVFVFFVLSDTDFTCATNACKYGNIR
jgi:hypothetical protein